MCYFVLEWASCAQLTRALRQDGCDGFTWWTLSPVCLGWKLWAFGDSARWSKNRMTFPDLGINITSRCENLRGNIVWENFLLQRYCERPKLLLQLYFCFSLGKLTIVSIFSSSVFHSILIVAVLVLFVLFVIGPSSVVRKQSAFRRREIENHRFSFQFCFWFSWFSV